MNRIIEVGIRDKIAVQTNDNVYVCGNSDFVVHFDFDDEWAEHECKTARFIFNGNFIDVVFSNNECTVPVISDTYKIKVGVYAGDLRTTTPALVSATKSILCGTPSPAAPHPDVYAQMKELFEAGVADAVNSAAVATEAKDTAVEAKDRAVGAEQVATEAAHRAEELSYQIGMSSGLQADLNQNNPSAAGYVHGRTHWVEYVVTEELLPATEATVLNAANNAFKIEHDALGLVEGEVYRVTYNGADYDCVCEIMTSGDGATVLTLGDAWYGKYPFHLMTDHRDANGNLIHDVIKLSAMDGAASVTVAVQSGKYVVHPIPAKFLRLTSPGGTVFELTVADDGTLSAVPVAE